MLASSLRLASTKAGQKQSRVETRTRADVKRYGEMSVAFYALCDADILLEPRRYLEIIKKLCKQFLQAEVDL